MWELSTQFSLTRPRGSQFDDTTTSSVPVVSVDACVMIMLQPQKTEQNELYKTRLHGTQCFQRQFGGQRGCWCEQKTTLPTPLPQQTYYAAVRVRGEGWEVRGERRGGGCGAAGEVLASGWWLSPSSEHQLPLTHTHICWHSCVSTLYALTYSTSVPPSSSHFSLFSTKTFSLFDASIIHSFFMQVLHVFARSVLRSQSDIYPVRYTRYDAWQIVVYSH